jgi:succinyl-CoA synthetase beta subunit
MENTQCRLVALLFTIHHLPFTIPRTSVYLLEHDAKEVLAQCRVPVPAGSLVAAVRELDGTALPPGPWVVKGQISVGGRGKAGIVRKAATPEELRIHVGGIIGTVVGGRRVASVRIEQQVSGVTETYLGLMLDAAAGGVRIIASAQGGVEVESLPHDAVHSAIVAPDVEAIMSGVHQLTGSMPAHLAAALDDAASRLARVFLDREALLIEINPLFVRPDGSWVAGDAKLVTDDNALERQPVLRELLERRAAAYPETALKLNHGFDYVVVDPEGEIGLLTTGAGLSMMLIDELRAAGLKPYNFLDIRTGGLRGETTRLVSVLDWIARGPQVKTLLINIFAGITELGEFSRLLAAALAQSPLRVPVVARLVGNGLPAARVVLARAGIPLYTELDDAVAEVRVHLSQKRNGQD